VKEAFPFDWFFWFAWSDFGGGKSGTRFNINDLITSFEILFRIRIILWLKIFQLGHE
jgi:hypothetical protein